MELRPIPRSERKRCAHRSTGCVGVRPDRSGMHFGCLAAAGLDALVRSSPLHSGCCLFEVDRHTFRISLGPTPVLSSRAWTIVYNSLATSSGRSHCGQCDAPSMRWSLGDLKWAAIWTARRGLK